MLAGSGERGQKRGCLHRPRAKRPRFFNLKASWGTSPAVQWLRLGAPNAGGPGSVLGQGTRSHMLQLSSHATTKDPTCHNEDPVQSHRYIFCCCLKKCVIIIGCTSQWHWWYMETGGSMRPFRDMFWDHVALSVPKELSSQALCSNLCMSKLPGCATM